MYLTFSLIQLDESSISFENVVLDADADQSGVARHERLLVEVAHHDVRVTLEHVRLTHQRAAQTGIAECGPGEK